MVTSAGRREKYDVIRNEFADSLWEQVIADMESFASGEFAVEAFGTAATSLDAVCLMAMYEKYLPSALGFQIQQALQEGYTWSDVAAALGVSRQAAEKRRFA